MSGAPSQKNGRKIQKLVIIFKSYPDALADLSFVHPELVSIFLL